MSLPRSHTALPLLAGLVLVLQPVPWGERVAGSVAPRDGAAGAVAPSRQEAREGVDPADVYARVALVRSELELVRREMGRRADPRPEPDVRDASPREVFFQAVTLFRKANRLSFERAREQAPIPEPPAGTIRPAHVLAVVDSALGRLGRVKASLGIPESGRPVPPEAVTRGRSGEWTPHPSLPRPFVALGPGVPPFEPLEGEGRPGAVTEQPLETSFVTFRVPRWHRSFCKRAVKAPKIHLVRVCSAWR